MNWNYSPHTDTAIIVDEKIPRNVELKVMLKDGSETIGLCGYMQWRVNGKWLDQGSVIGWKNV